MYIYIYFTKIILVNGTNKRKKEEKTSKQQFNWKEKINKKKFAEKIFELHSFFLLFSIKLWFILFLISSTNTIKKKQWDENKTTNVNKVNS